MSSLPKPSLPTTEQALDFLKEHHCNERIIEHSLVVAKNAVDLADSFLNKGTHVDRSLIWLGALLHDVGRSITSDVRHGAEGARILRQAGFNDQLARIAERHVGAGIPREEAKSLGLPIKNYLPETLEEKIVCYADKLVSGKSVTDIDYVIKSFAKELGKDHPSIERFKRLHQEIMNLVNG